MSKKIDQNICNNPNTTIISIMIHIRPYPQLLHNWQTSAEAIQREATVSRAKHQINWRFLRHLPLNCRRADHRQLPSAWDNVNELQKYRHLLWHLYTNAEPIEQLLNDIARETVLIYRWSEVRWWFDLARPSGSQATGRRWGPVQDAVEG